MNAVEISAVLTDNGHEFCGKPEWKREGSYERHRALLRIPPVVTTSIAAS